MKQETQNKQFNIQELKIPDSQNSQIKQKNFSIRKKIAGAGSNSIIVIPKLLQADLPKGTVVELNIKVLEEADNRGRK